MRVLQDDSFDPTDKKSAKLIERYVARAIRDLKEIEPKIQKSKKRKTQMEERAITTRMMRS